MNTTTDSKSVINFRVVKHYPGFHLDCEATFSSGITAILGPSGSGKTTLLNCIAGLLAPDAGNVSVASECIYNAETGQNTPPEKRRFGYIFQETSLFPHMSVWDNILYGYNLTASDLRTINPNHMVELFQLSNLRSRDVSSLSGGERQRVSLARSLATSPKLLLLDEPLASLDITLRGTTLTYLKRVWEELQIPMVYVSHSISEVLALAQDALVLTNGSVVAQGKPHDILIHPETRVLANHTPLENLLEARVVSQTPPRLKLGSLEISVPKVHSAPGESVMISIGAREIILSLEIPTGISARNVLESTVDEIHSRSDRILVYVNVGQRLVVEITPEALNTLDLKNGQRIYLIIKSNSILMMDLFT